MTNQKGFAIFEVIITWGLISGILLALMVMQMLSVTISLDGLDKTQYVLNLASHGECLNTSQQHNSKWDISTQLLRCDGVINYSQNDVEVESDNKVRVKAEFKQHQLLMSYQWHNSRQHQQTTTVVISL